MKPTSIIDSTRIEHKLPWWTWVVPFILFPIGSYISLLFKFDTGVGSFYLPTAIAVVLINWWGPQRTLPALYICSTLFSPFWGVELWWQWLIYPICETTYAAMSWFLFTKLARGKYWLPDTKQFVLFIFFALLIPLIFDLLALQALLTIFGAQPKEFFWPQFIGNWLGEFTANFGICAPVLFSFTRILQNKTWLISPPDYTLPKPNNQYKRLEPTAIYVILLTISFFLPFEKYWYLYGLGGLYIAIRFGFGEALFCNLYIFLITYIVPNYNKPMGFERFSSIDPIMNIFLGNILLYVFVAFAGRAISDLRQTEEKLNDKLQELKHTNAELDRFVYSVSHDFSAPLKSIQGLVNISKLDASPNNKEEYLTKIGASVSKLDLFIKEILDYSRNNRLAIQQERIVIKELCTEVIEGLKYMDNFQKIKFELSGPESKTIFTDRIRLKIIMNNLLSNAIKFQKKFGNEIPLIQLSCFESVDSFKIIVEDNGEGIRPEIMPKIFDMFFRGHPNSNGSGLGLYIAREAAEKLRGNIMVSSEYGKGTTFTVEIPLNV
jgi:two-component system, sensor histidine kinase